MKGMRALPDGRLLVSGDAFRFAGSIRRPMIEHSAQPGRAYVLEVSEDLVSWAPVVTQESGGAVLRLTDPSPAGSPYRFYRVWRRN
ncbi:MAG: hypothetical protein FJ404_07815 [Verrucomicrobia bacterium]|nr:hypothetical protein [Verrucomicrobiota bacterium]